MKSNQHGTNILSLSMAQDLIQYIEINILEPLTPASIAAHFYTSTSTLSLLFKIVLQMPIMEYVRNRRISLATEELINSNLPIIELAYKYRYETPLNGNDDTFLYQNTDPVQINNLIVPVQSLQFYYENAEKTSEYYKIVED